MYLNYIYRLYKWEERVRGVERRFNININKRRPYTPLLISIYINNTKAFYIYTMLAK